MIEQLRHDLLTAPTIYFYITERHYILAIYDGHISKVSWSLAHNMTFYYTDQTELYYCMTNDFELIRSNRIRNEIYQITGMTAHRFRTLVRKFYSKKVNGTDLIQYLLE